MTTNTRIVEPLQSKWKLDTTVVDKTQRIPPFPFPRKCALDTMPVIEVNAQREVSFHYESDCIESNLNTEIINITKIAASMSIGKLNSI